MKTVRAFHFWTHDVNLVGISHRQGFVMLRSSINTISIRQSTGPPLTKPKRFSWNSQQIFRILKRRMLHWCFNKEVLWFIKCHLQENVSIYHRSKLNLRTVFRLPPASVILFVWCQSATSTLLNFFCWLFNYLIKRKQVKVSKLTPILTPKVNGLNIYLIVFTASIMQRVQGDCRLGFNYN